VPAGRVGPHHQPDPGWRPGPNADAWL